MEKIAILLMDHNSEYLEACKNILQVQGSAFSIDHATSGEEGIRKILQQKYDVVLLNYKINEEDGLKLLSRIGALRKNLPVIMLVDENKESIAVKALELGADDYIMKVSGDQTALPFTIQKVVERNKTKVTPTPITKSPAPKSAVDFKKQIQDAAYILDPRGHFLSANENMEVVSGYTEAELLELSVTDLLARDRETQFYQWFAGLNLDGDNARFPIELVTKYGNRQPVEIILTSLRNDAGQIIGYRGRLHARASEVHSAPTGAETITGFQLVNRLAEIMQASLNEPVNYLLGQLAEAAAQFFKFKKVTLALLDRRKRVFVKQAIVGQRLKTPGEAVVLEVPEEVIGKIFSDNYQQKVVYYSREGLIDFKNEQLRASFFHAEQAANPTLAVKWQSEDMLLLNLVDQNQHTFGYISFEHPQQLAGLSLELVNHLELLGRMAALAIENHYHYSQLERRNRRLKQLLVTNNIFKLHLNLNDLLKEVAWAIKFSLEFNLVGIALVTSKSGMLELRAVACDDKIIQLHVEELQFSLTHIAQVLREKYQRSKSYFLTEPEDVFETLKTIYHGARTLAPARPDAWQPSYLLLAPVISREQKISGFILVDDPQDGKIPSMDVLRTLEIIANQVAVAIDNRMIYFQMKKRLRLLERTSNLFEATEPAPEAPGIQRLVDRFLK
ncbi:response regulator [candidate division KSB1 bacterium]|nr:response regulator [candidate division KSB1 bacterium]